VTRTAALLGDRVGASLEISPSGSGSTAGALARAQLLAFATALQGRQIARCCGITPIRYVGAFQIPSSTRTVISPTGSPAWTDQGNVDATVSDNVYRIFRTSSDGRSPALWRRFSSTRFTQFVPYLLPLFYVLDGGLLNSQIYRVSGADTLATNGIFNHYLPGGSILAAGMRGSVIIPGVTGNYQIGRSPPR